MFCVCVNSRRAHIMRAWVIKNEIVNLIMFTLSICHKQYIVETSVAQYIQKTLNKCDDDLGVHVNSTSTPVILEYIWHFIPNINKNEVSSYFSLMITDLISRRSILTLVIIRKQSLIFNDCNMMVTFINFCLIILIKIFITDLMIIYMSIICWSNRTDNIHGNWNKRVL